MEFDPGSGPPEVTGAVDCGAFVCGVSPFLRKPETNRPVKWRVQELNFP